jgi:hypothetical protein
MPPIATRNVLYAVGVLTAGVLLVYAVIHISENKFLFITSLASVGVGCYMIGWHLESPYARREIERLEAEKRELQEKVRALKQMYLEDRMMPQAVEKVVNTPPPADTITIRGGPLRDLIDRLLPNGPAQARIVPPTPSAEPIIPSERERTEVRDPV